MKKSMIRGLMAVIVFSALVIVLRAALDKQDVQLVPYRVVDESRLHDAKQTFDVEVQLVDGRLPTEKELGDVALHLVKSARRADIAFVSFYLPDQWADRETTGLVYASTRHDPGMQITVNAFSLMDYPQYRDLASE